MKKLMLSLPALIVAGCSKDSGHALWEGGSDGPSQYTIIAFCIIAIIALVSVWCQHSMAAVS